MPLDLAAIHRGEPRPEDVNILLGFAYPAVARILGPRNHQDLEDVLAEALATFFRQGAMRMARLRTEEHAQRLFRRISRFKAYDFLRRDSRRHEDDYGDPPAIPADLEPTLLNARGDEIRLALRLTVEAGLEDVLRELIQGAGLEGHEPELLAKHVAYGMPQREFAERYGMRPGSVGALVRKVLQKIRRFLGLERGPLPYWYWGPDRDI